MVAHRMYLYYLSGSIKGTDCVTNVPYPCGDSCKPLCLIYWLGSHMVMGCRLLIIFMRVCCMHCSHYYMDIVATVPFVLTSPTQYEYNLVITHVLVMFNHGTMCPWPCLIQIKYITPTCIIATVEPRWCRHPWDTLRVSWLERCPYFRGCYMYTRCVRDRTKCPQGGVPLYI